MKNLVKFEFRKIWTKLTIISVVSLVLVSTILTTIGYYSIDSAVNSEGEEVKGIKAFRLIKNESKSTQGIMNQQYLDDLVEKFNSSKEKSNFEKKLGLWLTRFDVSNHIINYANYGRENYNIYMGLDFDFLKSEKEFYNQYKKTVKKHILDDNQKLWFKYSDKNIEKINEKVDKIKTPFKVDYYEGINNLMWQFSNQLLFVPLVIGFSLSSFFSKDSNNGIDELTLSSKYGRKKNMNARIIAGNIFALTIYSIFIATLLIEHSAMGSLQGWNQSIQNIFSSCIYNISLGNGVLIMIGQGLLTTLFVANLVMLISIKVKYSKLSTLLAIGSIGLLERLTYTENSIQLQLNPIYFGTSLNAGYPTAFNIFYFIGDKMLPYIIVFPILVLIYIIFIRILTKREYKKYKLN
ncbi:MAG: hypothetical protein ACRCYC_10540 [Paraclostridium sp.]|uniref:hypothetical protein n=1 Tax=Paraclostridium sp. TaxID=2023273 RepID=UPI003F412634